MRVQDVLDVIELVLGWELPDDVFPDAVKAQATSLLARLDPDGNWGLRAD